MQFDAILKAAGVPMQKLISYSPNLNAYIKRWIQSIKHEYLDHFVVFGERHLRYLVNECVNYIGLRPMPKSVNERVRSQKTCSVNRGQIQP